MDYEKTEKYMEYRWFFLTDNDFFFIMKWTIIIWEINNVICLTACCIFLSQKRDLRSLWLIINKTESFFKINQCIYRIPNLSLHTEKDVLIYICFNTCYHADIFRTRVDFVFRREVGGSDAFLRLIYCVDLRQLNFRVGEGPIPRHNNDKHYFKKMCI